jgi:carbon starvation protein CstA
MNDDREQQHKLQKLEAINDELARHKRMARLVLFLVVLVDAIFLALVVNHLWGHPWTPESLQGFIP